MIESPTTGLEALRSRLSFPACLGLLGILLVIEKIFLTTLIDTNRARNSSGFGALVQSAQHWGFRFVVTLLTVISLLAYVRMHEPTTQHSTPLLGPAVRFRWIGVHTLLLGALAPLSYALFRTDFAPLTFAAMAIFCTFVGGAVVAAAVLSIASWAVWLQGIRSLGIAWLYAAIAALLGTGIWQQSERLWTSAAALTFAVVTWILTPVLPTLSIETATHVIRGNHFAVEITEMCSGLEGLGLMLAFSIAWLIYLRREYIFPRALLLIPLSLAAIFGLNALRISALVLIGNAGYPDVASFGFHSQAGWIAFNGVACALVYFSRRSAWLNTSSMASPNVVSIDNATAIYLMPLLALLAAGMLSHALSGRFESLYPLRLIGVMAALWAFRDPLLMLARGWRMTWRGPVLGVLVFLIWIAAANWFLPVVSAPEPAALAAMMPLQRTLWLVGRCLTSVICVPLAEELAYRGYLMRRLTRSEFEWVPYRSVRWPALSITAIVFGVAHGVLWLPGIVAGLAYGLLAIRRDSLGDAVIAHATTNGLIAIAVVSGGYWALW